MRAKATMFGSEARQLLFDDPPQLPNELVLLDELRIKLGPQPPTDRLLHHIRASRGKLHWSVNSYFRELMSGSRQQGSRDPSTRCPPAAPSLPPQPTAVNTLATSNTPAPPLPPPSQAQSHSHDSNPTLISHLTCNGQPQLAARSSGPGPSLSASDRVQALAPALHGRTGSQRHGATCFTSGTSASSSSSSSSSNGACQLQHNGGVKGQSQRGECSSSSTSSSSTSSSSSAVRHVGVQGHPEQWCSVPGIGSAEAQGRCRCAVCRDALGGQGPGAAAAAPAAAVGVPLPLPGAEPGPQLLPDSGLRAGPHAGSWSGAVQGLGQGQGSCTGACGVSPSSRAPPPPPVASQAWPEAAQVCGQAGVTGTQGGRQPCCPVGGTPSQAPGQPGPLGTSGNSREVEQRQGGQQQPQERQGGQQQPQELTQNGEELLAVGCGSTHPPLAGAEAAGHTRCPPATAVTQPPATALPPAPSASAQSHGPAHAASPPALTRVCPGPGSPAASASTPEAAISTPMPVSQRAAGGAAAGWAAAGGPAAGQGASLGLESLPEGIVEAVLGQLGSARDLAACACTSRLLRAVAASDQLWHHLFRCRWGEVVFPTEPWTPPHTPASTAHHHHHHHLNQQLQHQHHHHHHHQPAPLAAAATVAASTVAVVVASTAMQQGVNGERSAGSAAGSQQPASLAPAALAAAAAGQPPRPCLHLTPAAAPPPGPEPSLPHDPHPLLPPSPLPCLPPLCPGYQGPVPPATSTASASWSPAAAGAQALLQDEVRQAGTAAGPAADQQQAGGLGMSLQPSAAGGQGSMGCSSRGRDGASYGGSHANAISLGWRDKYKEQASYAASFSCPRCGKAGRLVPLVYGFPSVALLSGMRQRQLILGGDHLIEDCHCWACVRCNASFRTYPFERPYLWFIPLVTPASHSSGSFGQQHQDDASQQGSRTGQAMSWTSLDTHLRLESAHGAHTMYEHPTYTYEL